MKRFVSTAVFVLLAGASFADPLRCDLAEYKASSGLTATVAADTLTITWQGDRQGELRMRFGINNGVPTIRELALQPPGGQWRRSAPVTRRISIA